MPIYEVQGPDGQVYEVEGPSPPTADQLAQMFGPAREATPPPAAATAGMMGQSTMAGDPLPQPFAGLGIRVIPDEQWAEMSSGERMRGLLDAGGKALVSAFGMGEPGREAVEHPKTTLATAAIPLAVKRAAPAILEGVKRVTGTSAARAGQNMQAAATAAKDAPVAGRSAAPALARARELQATGSRMPRVTTQLSRRLEQAQNGELSFREAQDFVSSMSRMSVNERNTLNPQMQRQIVAIRDALREALTESAETVGRGDQYARGVSEYARAMRAAERWEKTIRPTLANALKTGAKWTAGGAAAGYGASRAFSD